MLITSSKVFGLLVVLGKHTHPALDDMYIFISVSLAALALLEEQEMLRLLKEGAVVVVVVLC